MSSVTQRIAEIKQPRGGFIKPSQFEVHTFNDNCHINETENVHASVIGMAVDYMTRFSMGTQPEEAFKISLLGAKIAEKEFGMNGFIAMSDTLLKTIQGINAQAIISACKLSTFDVWYRNPMAAFMAKTAKETEPDSETIHNIEVMINRSLTFWKNYGPIIKDGFTFEPNGYTNTVNAGDGDFLTSDTLWDFKLSKKKPTSKHTLQLLMYWIMGQHSGQEIYRNIHRIGLFNPRLNTAYLLDMNTVPAETIQIVEKDVICYGKP